MRRAWAQARVGTVAAIVAALGLASATAGVATAVTAPATGPAGSWGSGPGATVTLDPSYQQPAFQGWGTALVWFANVTGGWPEAKRNELADALFGADGLGFTVARYNIGGGDSPETPAYMRPGAAVPGFWNRPASLGPVPGSTSDTPRDTRDWWDPNNSQDWNWNADANQRWWLRAAKARGANTFEAFSNSAPYFMTESGYASGNFDSSKDNLRTDQYDKFATYLTRVVQHVEQTDGVHFNTLSPVNEPNTSYWHARGGQEGSHWDPTSQAKMAIAARQGANALGLKTSIAAPDETNPEIFRSDWAGYSSAAKASIDQLNVHTYGTSQRVAPRDIAKLSGKNLWMSEVDLGPGGIPQNFQDMRPGLALSQHISEDIALLEPKAWVNWQSIENYRNMLPSAENQNWGLIQVDFLTNSPATEPVRKNKKYWTMAQYSRYIRPGDHIIRTDNANTVAAIRPAAHSATVVYRNDSSDPMPVRIDLSGFAKTQDGTAQTRVTSASENFATGRAAQIRNGFLTALVDPGSVTSFDIKGVDGVNAAKALFASRSNSLVVNQNSGKALAIASDGSSLVQKTPNSADATQRWLVTRTSTGWTNRDQYTLRNPATGKQLTTVDGNLRAAGASSAPAGRWTISITPDGQSTLLSGTTETVLDVGGQSTADGAGVDLWTPTAGTNQAWFIRQADVSSVTAEPVLTAPGTAPQLPATATVLYGDGRTEQRPVTWASVPPSDYANQGRFTVTGTVAGIDVPAKVTVYVATITRTTAAPVKTAVGHVPTLPSTVTGYLSTGGTLPLAVAWDPVTAADVATPGQVTVNGTVTATGGKAQVIVEVNPEAPLDLALNTTGAAYPRATATFTGMYDSTAAVLDGVVDSRRWTNWDPNAWRPADTLEVDLGAPKDVTGARVDFFDDHSATRPPATVDMQRQDVATGQWVSLTGGAVTLTDDQVRLERPYTGSLQRIRLVMTARPGTCIAISEVSIYGPGHSGIPALGTSSLVRGITLDGQPLAGFDPGTTTYTANVGKLPQVDAVTQDPFATVSVTQATAVPGTATVVAKSEDGSSTTTYTVNLR